MPTPLWSVRSPLAPVISKVISNYTGDELPDESSSPAAALTSDTAVPSNATNAPASPAPAAVSPRSSPDQKPGFFSKLNNFTTNNAGTLQRIGATIS